MERPRGLFKLRNSQLDARILRSSALARRATQEGQFAQSISASPLDAPLLAQRKRRLRLPHSVAAVAAAAATSPNQMHKRPPGLDCAIVASRPPLPPPPPPPSSPPTVGVRSHIAVAASLLFFSLSLSPAASICIFPLSPSGRYTSGRRHLAASCLAHTPARRCDFFSRGQGEVMFALVTFRKPAVSACQGATPGDFGVRGAVSSISRGPFPRPCVLSTSSRRRGDAKLFCQKALKEGRETRPFVTLC